MTSLLAKAFGKVMLAGEYAVLFGYKAIVLSIDREAFCTFESGSSWAFFTHTATSKQENHHPLFECVIKACSQAGFMPLVGKYSVDTSSFYDQKRQQKLGLGSSAAAITALCKVIIMQHVSSYDPKLLFAIAFTAHRDLNAGFGSGADVAASIYGGIISYCLNEDDPLIEIKDVKWPLRELIFVDVGAAQSTQPFIEKVTMLKQSQPRLLTSFCQESSTLCDELLYARGDTTSLIAQIDRHDRLLQALGHAAHIDIATKEHQRIATIAHSFGGSAKPSGAGGGDVSLAIVPPLCRDRFINSIVNLGFTPLALSINE